MPKKTHDQFRKIQERRKRELEESKINWKHMLEGIISNVSQYKEISSILLKIMTIFKLTKMISSVLFPTGTLLKQSNTGRPKGLFWDYAE